MNKKLIAIAIGAALGTLPLASQAGVKIYGHAQVEVADESVDSNLTGGTGNCPTFSTVDGGTWQDCRTVEDNARGRWGIKASEKLGNGMKAFAQFEWKLDTTEFKGSTTNRVMQVGLKGGWGTFMAGSLKSPYKYTGGVKYDPFVTTNAEARRNGGMSGGVYGHNGFVSNSIGYMTPKMNGFQGWIIYSPDEDGHSSRGDDGDWAASLKFSAGNWEVFVAGVNNEYNGSSSATTSDYSAWKIGGKVKFGNHTFLVQYEDANNFGQVKDRDGRILFLGYHLKSGNNLFVVQFGDGKLDCGKATSCPVNPQDAEWTYWTVGAIHKFSKTARAFAAFSRTSVDNAYYGQPLVGKTSDDGDRQAFTIGLRKDFST
ncbi:MAG TPA: porin [Chromatiales bacterium]|nr:porin [Chromatiales bacterium]